MVRRHAQVCLPTTAHLLKTCGRNRHASGNTPFPDAMRLDTKHGCLIGQRCRVGLAGVGQVAAVAGHAARSIWSRATWAVSRKVAMGVFP